MDRLFRLLLRGLVLTPFLLFAAGCAGDRPAALVEQGEPIGIQLLRVVPSLKDERFSTLLDFESKDDAVFCTATGGAGAIVIDKVHSGRSAFKIDQSASRLTIKLSSLLAGRPFPGSWTLVGGYFYSEQLTKITIGLDPAISAASREVTLVGGAWTAVFIELPSAAAVTDVPNLVFNLPSQHGSIWCDDIMLIDNQKIYTGSVDEAPGAATSSGATAAADVAAGIMPNWIITRRGLNFAGSSPGRFNFTLATSESLPGGWVIDEANPMRAIFHSSTCRCLTVYADGRAFSDGQFKPMSLAARDGTLVSQHRSPAQIEVAEGMGRVDRNTPGDANNDGYNETTGSYRIIASGPRIELRLIPTSSPVLSPILEISGLPFGKALVTLEGRLVEQTARTSRGTLLVELPAKIDRAVTVNVRIEE